MKIDEIRAGEDLPTFPGIYKITNTITGKLYIGSAKCMQARWKRHVNSLLANTSKHRKLLESFRKHGKDIWDFAVIEEVSDLGNLLQREQYWLDYYDTVVSGYNIAPTAGNTLGITYSAASRALIREKALGRIITADARKKISDAMKRRIFTKEHRDRLGTSSKRTMLLPEHRYRLRDWLQAHPKSTIGEANNFFGKKHTAESKAKMSEAILRHNALNPCTDELRALRSRNASGENNPMYGKPRSAETKQKIREKALARAEAKRTRAVVNNPVVAAVK